ncbi:MAG: M48 family metallopeptidase [Rhodobacteraceae bacterium]|nr:M48 family metallopeptidase [Paracoccaceae bacterium]
MFHRFAALTLLVGLTLSGCTEPLGTGIEPTAPGPGRGGQSQSQTLTSISASQPLPRSAGRTFAEVVARVEPVAEQHCRTIRPRSNCDFQIVVDDRRNQPPNAFQTIDEAGRPVIAFTLSLIADARNADELAFIMAHEAAHHISGHLARQEANATLGANVFGRLASSVAGASPERIRAAQELGAAIGARSYSQEFELEADAMGTIITARAGYDPLLGAAFFFRIPDPGDRFLGTHPPNAERVAIVRRTAAQLGL